VSLYVSYYVYQHKHTHTSNQTTLCQFDKAKCPYTEWRRVIGCLIFIGHFQSKSPTVSGSFAKNDLRLKASYESLPPCKMYENTIHLMYYVYTHTHTHKARETILSQFDKQSCSSSCSSLLSTLKIATRQKVGGSTVTGQTKVSSCIVYIMCIHSRTVYTHAHSHSQGNYTQPF